MKELLSVELQRFKEATTGVKDGGSLKGKFSTPNIADTDLHEVYGACPAFN